MNIVDDDWLKERERMAAEAVAAGTSGWEEWVSKHRQLADDARTTLPMLVAEVRRLRYGDGLANGYASRLDDVAKEMIDRLRAELAEAREKLEDIAERGRDE